MRHEEVQNTTCNKCGKTCLKGQGSGGEGAYGLIDAKTSGGYYSEALSDMTVYQFSMCEKCLTIKSLSGEYQNENRCSEKSRPEKMLKTINY